MGNLTERPKPLNQVRVLIVDDHQFFREGLDRALNRLADDIVVVGQCEDGREAIKASRNLKPDVILLDVNLPSMNGLLVARALKSEQTDVAIVMLTAYHDEEQVLHTMRLGASAYCPKGITPDDLIPIIRDVASGMYVVDNKRMNKRQLDEWINEHVESIGGSYIVDSEEHLVPLSPREMEILQQVTNGLSNKEIAMELGISQQTVKNHMTSILRKLNVEDRTQAAVAAIRRGWVRINH